MKFRIRFISCLGLAFMIGPQLRFSAALGNELIAEQAHDSLGSPEAERSFWDPNFWRDATEPLEPPSTPYIGDSVYFRSKSHLGAPMDTPARNMTIKTATALGFAQPYLSPGLSLMYFDGNLLHFDGTPDTPGDPFGQLSMNNGTIDEPFASMELRSSSIDFDHTLVYAQRILIQDTDTSSATYEPSGIQVTGNVAPQYNLVSWTATLQRTGPGAVSPLLVREGAQAILGGTTHYTFSPHPSGPNTGNATVFRAETGGQMNFTEVMLTNPTGVVFESDSTTSPSSIVVGPLTSTGKHVGADPLVLFRALGDGTEPSSPTILAQGGSSFSDLSGTFAHATNSGQIVHTGLTEFENPSNPLRVVAESGGEVIFSSIRTPQSPTNGSISLDWSADDGSLIVGGNSYSTRVRLDGGAHSVTVAGGSEIRLLPEVGAETGATLTLTASESDTILSMPFSFNADRWDTADPLAAWDHYNISVTNGATLRGGSLQTFGDYSYPASHTLRIMDHTNPSTFAVTNSTADYLNLILDDKVDLDFTNSSLRHVSCTIGAYSNLTVSGGSWRPENAASMTNPESLIAGGQVGNTQVNLTAAAAVHELDISIGEGSYGDLAPPFGLCTLTVDGGTVWTGSLSAASTGAGQASVSISGIGTNVGLHKLNLGATAFPNIFQGISGIVFGGFNTSTGGAAQLSVSLGGRVSVGCYTDAFGGWQQSEFSDPPRAVLNDSNVTLDATSAVFVGDVSSAAALDYRNGALVIGPEGYLLGTGTITGAAADGNDLVNAGGVISPGFSPGQIDVDGNFLMESGTLDMEIESNDTGGADRIVADQISILSGTIKIVSTVDFAVGSAVSVDLFETASLNIDPSVVVQIDPLFGPATFDRQTGILTAEASGIRRGDLNANGVADVLDAVLPASGSSVEWPTISFNPAGGSVFTFRRLDSSIGVRIVTVQWSQDLVNWTDILIDTGNNLPEVQIEENGSDPDRIQVTLPDTVGQTRIFARLRVE